MYFFALYLSFAYYIQKLACKQKHAGEMTKRNTERLCL